MLYNEDKSRGNNSYISILQHASLQQFLGIKMSTITFLENGLTLYFRKRVRGCVVLKHLPIGKVLISTVATA